MEHTVGFTKWDHKQNGDIIEELKTEPVLEYVGTPTYLAVHLLPLSPHIQQLLLLTVALSL
jgi:hypothetical protein